jgi:hypothetical protein
MPQPLLLPCPLGQGFFWQGIGQGIEHGIELCNEPPHVFGRRSQ